MSETYIGKGSYGTVVKKGKKVIKKCKLFSPLGSNENQLDSDFYIDDHSLREAIFYQIINKERIVEFEKNEEINTIPEVNVSIYQNKDLKFEMNFLGETLNKYKFKSKQETLHLFCNLLKTLYVLDVKGFTHGDLKPENICIIEKKNKDKETTYDINIIDYGSLCFWHNKLLHPNSYQRCTLYYVSPEELITNSYSKYNDIWSFGVIMFEWITDKSFILTLLKECNISQEKQQLFYDYTFGIKDDDAFNPTDFLSSFFQSIKYPHIFNMLKKYIDDLDFIKIIGNCLLLDTKVRCTAIDLLESTIFKYKVKENRSINNFQKEQLISLNDEPRENIHDVIWDFCKIKPKFGSILYGHSIMLFDRILLRLNETKEYIPYLLLSLLCICLSAMVVKGVLLKGSKIVELYNEIKSTDDIELNYEMLKQYFIIIFDKTQLFLFNKSPDMIIIEKYEKINYAVFRTICKKYILTTSTCAEIVDKYESTINVSNNILNKVSKI
jgi:serine/threonine protein kinase